MERRRIRTIRIKLARWTMFTALCLIGSVAFVVLASDENPLNPMPLPRWILIKAVSLAIVAICLWSGKKLHRKGCLPEYIDKILKED